MEEEDINLFKVHVFFLLNKLKRKQFLIDKKLSWIFRILLIGAIAYVLLHFVFFKVIYPPFPFSYLASKHPRLIFLHSNSSAAFFSHRNSPPRDETTVPGDTIYNSWRISKSYDLDDKDLQQRDQLVINLKKSLEINYILNMRKRLLSESPVKFLTFECSDEKHCGGFGDRVRGIVSAFYLALCTDRVFNVVWTRRRSNLENYFEINAAIYNVSQDTYSKKLTTANKRTTTFTFFNIAIEKEFKKWSSNPNLSDDLERYDDVHLRSNSFAALEGTLNNAKCKSRYESLVTTVELPNATFDMSVFISAAIRLIFEHPTDRLIKAFNHCIDLSPVGFSSNAIRLGIQIRNPPWTWGEIDDHTVSDNLLPCFSELIKTIVNTNKSAERFLIYVTSDNEAATAFINQTVADCCRANAIVVTDKCQDLPIDHLESSFWFGDAWSHFAKAFVDWLILTKMDRLVISRSGYSETASFYSVRPTQRLAKWASNDEQCAFHSFNVIGPHIRME